MPSDENKPEGTSKAGKPCLGCGKPVVEKFRPFCSARCRDVDLNRWLSGSYVIPGADDDDEDGNSSG